MVFSVKLSKGVAFERWECPALVDRPREVKEHGIPQLLLPCNWRWVWAIFHNFLSSV